MLNLVSADELFTSQQKNGLVLEEEPWYKPKPRMYLNCLPDCFHSTGFAWLYIRKRILQSAKKGRTSCIIVTDIDVDQKHIEALKKLGYQVYVNSFQGMEFTEELHISWGRDKKSSKKRKVKKLSSSKKRKVKKKQSYIRTVGGFTPKQ